MVLDHMVDILLEVKGSCREICIKREEDALVCLERKLGKIGKVCDLKSSLRIQTQVLLVARKSAGYKDGPKSGIVSLI